MQIIAHRGASGDYPENTLKAFQAALDQDVSMIEFDVQSCKDDIVVFHDRWLERRTKHKGRLKDKTLLELKRLDVGQGESIPTLLEVLTLVAGQSGLNIEIKAIDDLNQLLPLLELAVDKLGFSVEQIVISSFDHYLLREVKRLAPQWKIGVLCAAIPIGYAKSFELLQPYSLHLNAEFVSKAFIDDAHRRGLKVFVYTVDRKKDMAHFYKMGVDALFCNYPARAMRIVKAFNQTNH